MTKAEIAKLWSGETKTNAAQYLKRLGQLTIQGDANSKLWYVDKSEWPMNKRNDLE